MARCARDIDRFDGGGHLGGISDNIVFTCGEVWARRSRDDKLSYDDLEIEAIRGKESIEAG